MGSKKCKHYENCGLDYCDYGLDCPEYEEESENILPKLESEDE